MKRVNLDYTEGDAFNDPARARLIFARGRAKPKQRFQLAGTLSVPTDNGKRLRIEDRGTTWFDDEDATVAVLRSTERKATGSEIALAIVAIATI